MQPLSPSKRHIGIVLIILVCINFFFISATLVVHRSKPLAGITRNLTQKFDTLHIDTTGGALTITQNHSPLLTYVFTTAYPPSGIDTAYKKSGFIHPLYTPHGQILTRIQPPDHYHHYGVWDPYRWIVFNGHITKEQAETAWQSFSSPANVTILH